MNRFGVKYALSRRAGAGGAQALDLGHGLVPPVGGGKLGTEPVETPIALRTAHGVEAGDTQEPFPETALRTADHRRPALATGVRGLRTAKVLALGVLYGCHSSSYSDSEAKRKFICSSPTRGVVAAAWAGTRKIAAARLGVCRVTGRQRAHL